MPIKQTALNQGNDLTLKTLHRRTELQKVSLQTQKLISGGDSQ